jgi:hypothetical protein
MRRLYPKAESVILWLGEPHTQSDLYNWLDLLQDIAGGMTGGHSKVEYETVYEFLDISKLKFKILSCESEIPS